jgi:molybdenum cofactor biosynthesis enzyme MoaA
MLVDLQGRRVKYLRLSVTGRCDQDHRKEIDFHDGVGY